VTAALFGVQSGSGWFSGTTADLGVQVFRLVLVAIAAALLAYRVRTKPAEHGLLLGAVVAVCTVIGALVARGGFSPWDLAAVLAVGAGWLGGRLGRRAAGRQDALFRTSRLIAAARTADDIVIAIGDQLAGPGVQRITLWRVSALGGDTVALAPLASWQRRGADKPTAGAPAEPPRQPPTSGTDQTSDRTWAPRSDGSWHAPIDAVPPAPVVLQVDRLPPSERGRWDRPGDRAILILPLAGTDGERTAVLTVASADDSGFRRHTVRTYLVVAAQVGLALENLTHLEQAREAAVLEERSRLARDLHDSVTQSVFSLGMMARAAQAQYARGMPTVADTLDKIGALAGEALAEMRALLFELRPVALAEGGLRAALEQLAVSFRARTAIAVGFTAATDARPSPDAEMAIFRIVQEALGNAAKHAQATEVKVAMTEQEDRLLVTVADNGVGFDPSAPVAATADGRSGGLGLRSMRERAAAAGLALDLTSAPGAGTTVTIVAPLPAA
jgi:signal transduction histidine kinase